MLCSAARRKTSSFARRFRASALRLAPGALVIGTGLLDVVRAAGADFVPVQRRSCAARLPLGRRMVAPLGARPGCRSGVARALLERRRHAVCASVGHLWGAALAMLRHFTRARPNSAGSGRFLKAARVQAHAPYSHIGASWTAHSDHDGLACGCKMMLFGQCASAARPPLLAALARARACARSVSLVAVACRSALLFLLLKNKQSK